MNLNTKNLLLKLKNCSTSRLIEFYCNYTKKNIELIELLYKEGLIQSYTTLKKKTQICVFLRYFENKPVFKFLKLLTNSFNSRILTSLEISQLEIKRNILFLNTNNGFITLSDAKKSSSHGRTMFLC